MSALLVSRIVCLFLLLIGTLVFGILPVFIRNDRFGSVLSALKYFGGGILFGVTFIHLLPESREGFENQNVVNCSSNGTGDGEDHETFSMPEFIVCCGFFGVYFFEQIVNHLVGGHSHVPRQNIEEDRPPSQENHPDGEGPLVVSRSPSFSLTGLLTVAALSFHSLFEGFAVGLRPDVVSTWIVYAAIAVHKYVIAFVVGLETLATGGRNVHVYSYMGVFALMSPLGMAIAMITQNNIEDSNPMVVSVLNALATGTLLYVTFFEILSSKVNERTWLQFIATAAGFVVMCIMQYGSTFA